MATQVQFRRGTTAENNLFTGAVGEVTVDLNKDVCVVHDGTTQGGFPLMREDGSNMELPLGSVSNCAIRFASDYNTGLISPGSDQLAFVTGGAIRLNFDPTGGANFTSNVDISGSLSVSGAINLTGVVTFAAGSAATPSITFTGDTDTGIYSPGANQFAITTQGVQRVLVDNSSVSITGDGSLSGHLNIASAKEYRINSTKVLDATSLGSSVVTSSLTTLGTISTGVWQGSPITTSYGGTGNTSYTDGQLLIGKTDGTLAKATLTAGSNVTITNGDGSIQVASTDTTYTAGDGLDLTGTVFSADLKANGGLTIESTELAVDLGASSITGTLASGDGGTGQITYTDGQLLIGKTDGSLAKATLTAGSNVTITNGDGSIEVASTNTTYTAGDGLDLTGTVFSADLKANGGLTIESTELAVDLGASSITGTLASGDGGTGQTTYTDGQLLIGKTDGTLAKATLTAGSNVTITNTDGGITVASNAGVTSVTGTSPISSTGGATPDISIQDGTTTQKGAVQLEDSTSSTSTTTAATPNSVKSAYDLGNAALPKAGGTMTGAILGDNSTSPSTPGYAFDGDPDTGLLRPGINEVALVSGGVVALSSDSSGNIIIPGDLTVQGTTTTIDTNILVVKDKNIEIGVVATPTDITADTGGIVLKGSTDKSIEWLNATGAWTFSEHIDLASTKEYRINNVKVLDSTSLGSGVVSSSLTSVGTITSGTWQGSAIATGYGGTGQTTYTDGQLLIGNSTGNTLNKATLTAGSGVTITNGSGTITISAHGSGGTVTDVTATSPLASTGGATPDISIQDGTTAQKGAVQLEDSTSSTSTTTAATPNSVKAAYDLANAAMPQSGGTMTGDITFSGTQTFPGTVTSIDVSGGTGLTSSGGPITSSGTITVNLDNTAVTPGSYTYASITVDQQGRLTAASNGTTPLTSSDIGVTVQGYDADTAKLDVAQTFTAAQTIASDLTLNAQSDLRFADADSSNWVAFQAPATIASNVTWTLPDADGTAGQVLSTDGSGILSWSAGGGASVTTSDVAPSSPSDGDLWYDSVGGRTYVYYDDGNSSQWVDSSPQATATPTEIIVGNTKAEVIDTGVDGRFVVTTEGTEQLRVDSSGNAGFGTTNPGSRVDVKGTLRLSGSSSGYVGLAPAASAGSTTYTLPSADGTSGQFLSTNGSGNLSWASSAGFSRSKAYFYSGF